MKLRKRDLFLLVAAPALVLGAIGTAGIANKIATEVKAEALNCSLEDYDYTLVTDASTLHDGDLITIADKTGSYAIGGDNGNNRLANSITTSSNKTSITSFSTNVPMVIELGAVGDSANVYTLKDKTYSVDQYLYAAGGNGKNPKNYLKPSESCTNTNSHFKITITSTATSIVAQGDASRKNISFNSSNNPKIFSCYGSGQTEPIIYKITPKASQQNEDITISGATSVNKGSTTTVTADKSDGLSSSELTWHSSNESVASIDANGVVTGLAAGITTITATCEYNSQTITSNGLTITVIDTTPSLAISTDKTELVVGRNSATISLTPTNCTPDSVTWSSEDTNVATVAGDASSATVTPIAAGDTVIKATYDNGGDAVVSNEISIHVSAYGEVTVNNYLSLTSANLGVVTTGYAANNGVKVVDGVSYSLNNVQKSTGDKGSGIQLKVEDSLFCNLNAFSKNIYRIKIKLAYGTTLPNVYACDGLGQLDHQIEVSNNEARRTGTGYYEYDMSAEATKYFAITSNGSNAPYMAEIIIAFAPDTYLADFNLEGGSMDAEEIVELPETENTITLPTPVRANYEFAGWSDGENTYEGGTEVTIYKDTSFTALWDNTTILQTLVNGVESKMALAYHYISATVVDTADDLVAGAKYIFGYKGSGTAGKVAGSLSSEILGATSASVTNEKVVAVPAEATAFTLGGSSGAWTFQTEDGYLQPTAVKKLEFAENASLPWNITFSNTGVTTIASSNSSYGNLYYNTSSPRFTTYSNSSNQIVPMHLYRVYETPAAPQFRIKAGVTAAIADLATTDGVAECGVAVTAGNTTQRFALSDLHTDDTGIRYATIDLGDVVNNYSRATTAFMVRAYVKSGDDYIYTTDAEKYENLSVRDMVNVYHGMNDYKDKVDGLWSFFNAVSAY